MTRSGDELAANVGQPCPKGQNRGRMLALEAVNDGYRTIEVSGRATSVWSEKEVLR
jgi:hypothetical protein